METALFTLQSASVVLTDASGGAPGGFLFEEECRAAAAALDLWKQRVLDYASRNPVETLILVLGGGAWVFYLAEKDVNPAVRRYEDAVYYISTCLSVGYANIFPQTQIGKLAAAIVMSIGPALSSWLLESRAVERQEAQGLADPVLERLDAILDELRRLRGAEAGASSA